ncbi:MAG: transcriptional regulator [Bacteroidia bacterium]|nr:transcriptional regulator [Bacteroidia bacterium]
MTYAEGREKFIDAWGNLGSSWGIPKTMAQIHALLLVSTDPLNCDNVMEILEISRGNANTNIRALCEWELIHKRCMEGCRKEYFVAEKDMWSIVKQIIINRKKKELEPLIDVLNEVSCVQDMCNKSHEFCKLVDDLKRFSTKADDTLNRLVNTESKWVMGTFINLMK